MPLSTPPSLVPLLRSNNAPSPSEKRLVEEILRDQQAELSALGDEIFQLESTLRALRKKHADLAAAIYQYSCILSPIRHTPPEIIREIFIYFAPPIIQESECDGRSYGTRLELPWQLGQICHQWRAISLSLGPLWAVLDLGPQWCFRIPDFAPQFAPCAWEHDEGFAELPVLPPIVDGGEVGDSKKDSRLSWVPIREGAGYFMEGFGVTEDSKGFEIGTSLDYIEKYLQRSGNHPFSFRLWADDFAAPVLLEGLLKYSALWRGMVLFGEFSALVHRISHFDSNLQGVCKVAFLLPHSIINFQYSIVPNLTDLTLVGVDVTSEGHSQIPWSQLTKYCEMDCSWPHDESRLASYRKLTNLRILRLRSYPSDYLFFPDAPVVLPNLCVASFHFGDYFMTGTLSSLFDMPVLEDFTTEYSSTRYFGVLVPYSSPRLRSLRVRGAYQEFPLDDPCGLERALEKFPDLTEISIDVPNLISNIDISRLVPCHDQLPLIPKLEMLRLSNRSFIHQTCKWQTLLEMLQARFRPTTQGISRLRTFEFSTDALSNDIHVVSGLTALGRRNQWDIRVNQASVSPSWDDCDS